MNIRSSRVLRQTPVFVPWAMVAVSLFLYFDLTDESYYLYSFIYPKTAAFNFYNVFLHPIGELFGHSVLAYRWLNLIGVGLSAFYFCRNFCRWTKLETYLPLFLTSVLFNFTLIPTVSYNSFLFAIYLVLFGALFGEQSKTKTILLYPLLIFLAFSCRGTQVLILSAYILILGYLVHRKIYWQVAIGILACLITILLNPAYFKAAWDILGQHSRSVHNGVVLTYLKTIADLVVKYFLVWGALFLLIRKFLPRWKDFFYLGGILIFAIATREPEKIYKMILVMTLLRLIESRAKYPGTVWWVYFIGAYTAIVIPIGTNNNLVSMSIFFLGLSLPFIVAILRDIKGMSERRWEILICVILTLTLIQGRFLAPYRNVNFLNDDLVLSKQPYLTGLWIPQTIEESIKDVRTLSPLLREGEKIFGYQSLPAVALFSGHEAYGTPWYFSGYPNLDGLACTYIRLENSPLPPVFALSDELSPGVIDCLKNRGIDPLSFPEIVTIRIWTHRKKDFVTVSIRRAP